MNLTGRISKEALSHASVISQVDRKFILVKLPLQSLKPILDQKTQSSALIMLDQHAADERVRLENLMGDYFTKDATSGQLKANVELLERPITFEVSPRESQLLEQHRDYFANWGIQYHPKPKRTAEIVITALPPSILERCRLEPRLLIETLRKEIWRIVDQGLPTRSESQANFHGCPRGILELLHSRACRSAIMFNDVLTKTDCETLLARLAKCAFPFQCAHGRPSMAPLLDMGSGSRFGAWQEDTRRDGEKWKSWIK